MKQAVFTIVGALLVPIVFWLGGFDFDHRGEGAVMCFIITVAVAFISYTGYDVWKD